MATITVGSGNTMRPYRKCRLVHYPESASQSFRVGDVLVLDTVAGKQMKCKKAGADPIPVLGVAADSASGVEGTRIGVYVATAQSEFRAMTDSSTTLPNTAIGTQFGIVEDSTNFVWRVDQSETTNKRVVITEVPNLNGNGTYGDTNAEVVFRFIETDSGSTSPHYVPYGN